MSKFYSGVFTLSCLVLFAPVATAQTPAFSAANKTVKVYTTAKGTDYRLSQTETLKFADKAQPLETEICVFVDPAKPSKPCWVLAAR